MSETAEIPISETCRKPINPKSLANLRPPWKKGECPEGAGRPKGAKDTSTLVREVLQKEKYTLTSLMKALEALSAQRKKDFFMHLAERSMENDVVATKLLDKLLPNASPDVVNAIQVNLNINGIE